MARLHVGQYNTYMLDRIAKQIEQNASAFDGYSAAAIEAVVGSWFAAPFTRVDPLCDKILASPYDIICLEEVFDEESREQFIKRLSKEGPFPYYTNVLGDPVTPGLIHAALLNNFLLNTGPLSTLLAFVSDSLTGLLTSSGLLLFSRYPFIPDANGRKSWFVKYSAKAGKDAMAPKGGAAVVVEPTGLPRMVVGITHLQSSTGEENAAIRLKQSTQWVNLIVAVAKATNTQHLLACGDLNVIGEKNLVPTPEYKSFFGPDRLFGQLFREPWAETHSHWDAFATFPRENPAESERIDYVLTGLMKQDSKPSTVPVTPLSVHHLMLAYNLLTDSPQAPTPFAEPGAPALSGNMPLSDHYGVNAVINLLSPCCTPQLAQVMLFKGGVATQKYSVLGNGSYFWLRLNDIGSGTAFLNPLLGAADGNLETMVFGSTDLSSGILAVNPANWTRDEQVRQGNRFILPSPPVFIRLRQLKPTGMPTTSEYMVTLTRGESRKMAIYLPGAEWKPAHFPGTPGKPQPLNADDTMWFECRPNQPTAAGTTQTLEFRVIWGKENTTSAPPYMLWLEDESGLPISEKVTCKVPSGSVLKAKLKVSKPTIIYPRLHRLYPSAPAFTIGWQSDLTLLHGKVFAGRQVPNAGPLYLRVGDETSWDWLGDDEPYLTVEIDGSAPKTQEYGDVSNGDCLDVSELAPFAYVQKVELTTGESSKDDDNTLLPLPASSRQPLPQVMQFEIGTGNYELWYSLSHWLEPTKPG